MQLPVPDAYADFGMVGHVQTQGRSRCMTGPHAYLHQADKISKDTFAAAVMQFAAAATECGKAAS